MRTATTCVWAPRPAHYSGERSISSQMHEGLVAWRPLSVLKDVCVCVQVLRVWEPCARSAVDGTFHACTAALLDYF